MTWPLLCAQGKAGVAGRTERKRALTGEASSRSAGAITRTSNNQCERAWRNLRDHRVGLQRAIASIDRRLAMLGERRGRSRGYASQAERFQKQRRLRMLKWQAGPGGGSTGGRPGQRDAGRA